MYLVWWPHNSAHIHAHLFAFIINDDDDDDSEWRRWKREKKN